MLKAQLWKMFEGSLGPIYNVASPFCFARSISYLGGDFIHSPGVFNHKHEKRTHIMTLQKMICTGRLTAGRRRFRRQRLSMQHWHPVPLGCWETWIDSYTLSKTCISGIIDLGIYKPSCRLRDCIRYYIKVTTAASLRLVEFS